CRIFYVHLNCLLLLFFFFFQAEDGIRDLIVTGVQTCALPICSRTVARRAATRSIDSASSRFAISATSARNESANRTEPWKAFDIPEILTQPFRTEKMDCVA